ncbi:hypothetical protein [Methanothrix sp.]|uniref:hypothetical protein n=1 Tax=Methanothrix sp. TaxID=90426 RepID=UPI0034E1BE83
MLDNRICEAFDFVEGLRRSRSAGSSGLQAGEEVTDNRQSALDGSVHYGRNIWDNGSEGNYYSDHVCQELCGAYEIPSGEEINSIDRFPLSSWEEGFMYVRFVWPIPGCVPAYAKGLAI